MTPHQLDLVTWIDEKKINKLKARIDRARKNHKKRKLIQRELIRVRTKMLREELAA